MNKPIDRRDMARTLADCAREREAQAQHIVSLLLSMAEHEKCAAERERLAAELGAIKHAAHMPEDYEFGLPSWINQRLYACYVGAAVSEPLMALINSGRLTFPESPAEARAAAAEAELERVRGALRKVCDAIKFKPGDTHESMLRRVVSSIVELELITSDHPDAIALREMAALARQDTHTGTSAPAQE